MTTPDPAPDATPDVTSDTTPDAISDAISDTAPGAISDATPDPILGLDRRRFMLAVASAGALAAAGCTGLVGDDDPENPGDDADDGPADAAADESGDAVETADFEVETVVDGLEHPWGLAFLPDEPLLLVTERPGRLRLVDREDDSAAEVEGAPEVYAAGQGGLLDVTLHPAFPEEPWVYLTYSAANEAGESATHVGRGRLDRDDPRLEGFEAIHAAEPFVDSDDHYGSRAVFGEAGALYVTTGDRASKDFGPEHVSQQRDNDLGATLRLGPDGAAPDDNPFVDDPDASDALFSFGHRNPQGMTVRPETGVIWQSEHGEQDGDEINVVQAAANYGWPIADHGCTYGEGEDVGDDPEERDDVVEPVHYWECDTGGFPPGGTTFYDGPAFDAWQGDLFVGNLAGEYLGRFVVEGAGIEDVEVTEVDPLLADRGWRVRDAEVAPDSGHLYVAVDAEDAPIVRLVPA